MWGGIITEVVCLSSDSCGKNYSQNGDINGLIISATFFFYSMYLFDAFILSSTIKYLKNIHDQDTINDLVNNKWRNMNNKNNSVQIQWKVTNYRLQDPKDDKSKRIETQSFEKSFEYKTVEDMSGLYEVNSYSKKPLIKLQFGKKLAFANKITETEYNNQLYDFVNKSKTDTQHRFDFEIIIDEFQERMICDTSESSLFFNKKFYLVITILGFSWFYRKYLDSKSDRKSFYIIKRISV